MKNFLRKALRKMLRLVNEERWGDILKLVIKLTGKKQFAEITGIQPDFLRVPPGHFYSCYPDVASVNARSEKIFGEPDVALAGIDENIDQQLALAAAIEPLISDFPYSMSADGSEVSAHFNGQKLRYRCHEGNRTFHLDAVTLQAMLRHFKPQRIIEIGSGYSSAVMLDVREMESWTEQKLTFVEPYSQNYFFPLLRPEDRESIRIIEQPLWEVDRAEFESLQRGDLLFIDSSHVAKTGSDVYDYLFNVLPRLNSGVLIHVHDITPFFETAPGWFNKGWYWNEGAFLRAFLMYNDDFEIVFHSSLLRKMHADAPGIRALVTIAKGTFIRRGWRWGNSFYLRRK